MTDEMLEKAANHATFIVVVLAPGSVVFDVRLNGRLGIPFIAFAPFVRVAIGGLLVWKNVNGSFQSCSYFGFSNY
jgi:aquaporin Z